MMQRNFISLDDIRAIRLACKFCHAVVEVKDVSLIDHTCPVCHKELFQRRTKTGEANEPLLSLAAALDQCKALDAVSVELALEGE